MKVPTMNISARPDEKLTSLNTAGRINGCARVDHVHQEQINAEAGEHRLGDDLAGREPVLILAAVQHQLHRADPQRQHGEAEPVEAQSALPAAARQEDHQPGGGEQPNGRLI